MKEYLLGVVAVSVIGGFLTTLSHGNYKRTVKASVGVIMAIVILTPLFSFRDLIADISDYIPVYENHTFENGYYKVSEEAFMIGIKGSLADKFSVQESNIEIRIADFDMESMRAGAIDIVLSGPSVTADLVGIKQYVKGNFVSNGGRCEVGIEIG